MFIPAVEIEVPQVQQEAVLAEVSRLLKAGRFSQGENVARFEERFADLTGTRHGVAVSSGTTALELILRAQTVAGGTVVVPANTNFATYIAAERAGAGVVLCDVDPMTLSPTASEIERVCRTHRPAAVVVVHMGGHISHEIEAIAAVCARYGVPLVEDCAHAHGSRRGDRHAGSFGCAGAFSFFATKVMSTGEGGMVVTDQPALAEEVRLLRNLGKAEAWRSEHSRLGTNGRMTEISAVLGLAQLSGLEEAVAGRREIARRYSGLLEGTGLEVVEPDHPYSGYKVVVMLPEGVDRDRYKAGVKEGGVQLSGEVYELPLHHQPVLRGRHTKERHPGAEESCARQVCPPIYPTLDADRVGRVVEVLIKELEDIRGG